MALSAPAASAPAPSQAGLPARGTSRRLRPCWADVHHEVVRRIGRQAALPVPQQVITHQREQQQHHEAEAESHDLHDAVAAASCNVREAISPGDAHAAAQRRSNLTSTQPAMASSRNVAPRPPVTYPTSFGSRTIQSAARARHLSPGVDDGVPQRRRLEIAAQDTGGRHTLQAQQRRSATDEHDDRRDDTERKASAEGGGRSPGSTSRSSQAMPDCAT